MLVVFQGDMILKCSMKHQLGSCFNDGSGPSVFAGLVLTSKIKEDAANASGLAP